MVKAPEFIGIKKTAGDIYVDYNFTADNGNGDRKLKLQHLHLSRNLSAGLTKDFTDCVRSQLRQGDNRYC